MRATTLAKSGLSTAQNTAVSVAQNASDMPGVFMPGIAALEPCASIMFLMTSGVIQHRCF